MRINIRGFLVREPDAMLQSYADIEAELDKGLAAGEPIVLDVDCRGGDAIGVKALADKIFAHRDQITAYVSGYCASAAYYLTAATSRITAAQDAIIGSVGAMAWPPERGDAKVATLSPLKNSGEDLQAIVDDSCERFLADVARYRGFSGSVEEVSKQVGSGALFTAREALSHNLIDEVDMEDQIDREDVNEAGVAALLPKIMAKLDELASKMASADERVGLLEERLDALKKEDTPEGEVSEECRPKAAEGEELPPEEKKEDEAEKQAQIVDCLIDCLKRDGKILAKEESRAIRLLNADVSLFKEIFVQRQSAPMERMSMAAKSAEPVGKTRNERARQYMQRTGCSYTEALAREIEQENR